MNDKFYSNLKTGVEPQAKKEESILRKPENLIALAIRLKDICAKRLDIKAFIGVMPGTKFSEEYSADNIARDEIYTETTLTKIYSDNSSKGQVLLDHFEDNFAFAEAAQAMITDLLNKWLPDFKTIMTSVFDDLRVGIDMVMKHKDGGYFGVAFDATVSSNPNNIKSKLKKNWDNNIAKGSLPVVKYFQDPDNHEKSRIMVPKFIIGASATDINDMAKAYLSGNEESLDNHPFRKLMLDQIESQLDDILNFYENNPSDKRFSFAYRQYLKVEQMVKDAKKQLAELKIIDPLVYHEYSKKSLALEIINEFASKKKLVISE